MIRKEERHLALELLLFFFFISIMIFLFYLIRHPVFLNFIKKENSSIFNSLTKPYLFDLIIFLSVLIPYLLIIILLIFLKVLKKINKITDNVMIILFFPLISFFTKGMSLIHVYIDFTFIEILEENYAFFLFLFIGPVIVFSHKLVIYFKKKKIKNIYLNGEMK